MTSEQQIQLQAAAFRRLLNHLDNRKDVQNIELMNLAGFCRNCLSKWMMTEASLKDIDLDYEQARELIYGMPFAEWKEQYQRPATAEQLATFEKIQANSKSD